MDEEDALSMPVINPILSSLEDVAPEIIDVPVPGPKGSKDSRDGSRDGSRDDSQDGSKAEPVVKDTEDVYKNYIESLEKQVHRLKREELRGVMLMAIVLNFNDRNIRKRVIESVHSHLLNKHRILEYVVAQQILPLSAVKDDIRLLELEKQMVLKQIDATLESVVGLKHHAKNKQDPRTFSKTPNTHDNPHRNPHSNPHSNSHTNSHKKSR